MTLCWTHAWGCGAGTPASHSLRGRLSPSTLWKAGEAQALSFAARREDGWEPCAGLRGGRISTRPCAQRQPRQGRESPSLGPSVGGGTRLQRQPGDISAPFPTPSTPGTSGGE